MHHNYGNQYQGCEFYGNIDSLEYALLHLHGSQILWFSSSSSFPSFLPRVERIDADNSMDNRVFFIFLVANWPCLQQHDFRSKCKHTVLSTANIFLGLFFPQEVQQQSHVNVMLIPPSHELWSERVSKRVSERVSSASKRANRSAEVQKYRVIFKKVLFGVFTIIQVSKGEKNFTMKSKFKGYL